MSDYESGNFDFEFESDGGCCNEAEEIDDLDVQIENTFYEAEDYIVDCPDLAVTQFLKVIELNGQQGDGRVHWTFKSLLNIIVTCARLERYKDVLVYYERLLLLLNKVTRNEASEAINQVINALGTGRSGHQDRPQLIGDGDDEKAVNQRRRMSEELKNLERVYEITLETLKRGGYQKLWLDTSMRLANLYIQQNNVSALKKSVRELYSVFAPSDDLASAPLSTTAAATGSLDAAPSTMRFDISKQSASLFELYTLDTQLCLMTKDTERMHRVYPKTLQMAVSVTDPRTVATLRQSGGLMYMDDKKWNAAYSEFFEAFKNYQEIGSAGQAKQALKFVVVANLLSLSEINPFHSPEASVYQDDPEIMAIHQLRLAFDSKDIQKIGQVLTDPSNPLLQDSAIVPYLADLLRNVRLQLVQQTIAPYTSIKLSQIAETLSISESELMPLVVKIRSSTQFGVNRESKGEKLTDEKSRTDEAPHLAVPSWPHPRSALAVDTMFTEYSSVITALTELSRRVEGNEGTGSGPGTYADYPRYCLRSSSKRDGGCSHNLYQQRLGSRSHV